MTAEKGRLAGQIVRVGKRHGGSGARSGVADVGVPMLALREPVPVALTQHRVDGRWIDQEGVFSRQECRPLYLADVPHEHLGVVRVESIELLVNKCRLGEFVEVGTEQGLSLLAEDVADEVVKIAPRLKVDRHTRL